MRKFFRLSFGALKHGIGRNSLRHSYEVLAGLFSNDSREEVWRHVVFALIYTLLNENGTVAAERVSVVRRLIESKKGTEEAARGIRMLNESSAITPEEAADALKGIGADELEKLLNFLIQLALRTQTLDHGRRQFLVQLAEHTGISPDDFERMVVSAKAGKNTQDHLLRSGAGLIAAIVVIAVFVLTATLLRSVIFGLIGAYLLLPVEKYFERKIRSRKGVCFACVRLSELLLLPLYKLSNAVRRKSPESGIKTLQQQDDRRIIKQAISFTVVLVSVFAVAIGIFLSSVTGKYVDRLKNSVTNLRDHTGTVQTDTLIRNGTRKVTDCIENWKKQLENSPLIRMGVEFLQNALDDDGTRKELAGMILRSTGGVVNFTAGLIGTAAAVIGDIILTVFFGLLFLFKLAEFCRLNSSYGKQSEYLIRTVFNGNWLPGANESVIAEARNILIGTFSRLRIWVRGYLLLVLIDSTVYTTAFCLLDIPYFPILGIIAGCGILLPYIGPVCGCALTLLVTLAAGDSSGLQILLLLVFYLIYSGVVEQFILYPAVIGESLGLTALETVIVVLLGAVFAGIAGMIFALPAASVIKYIVPQIYRCLEKKQTEEFEEKRE